jgi:hypothetical protein
VTVGAAPSITDWITAVGTAGGFLAAGFGFLYDRYRHRKTERYAQARLVDGWLKNPEYGESEWKGDKRPTMKLIGYVSNSSRAAVRDVKFMIRPNPYTESPLFAYFRAGVGTVPPTLDGQPFPWSHEFRAGVEYDRDVDFQKKSLRGYILWVHFTDNIGQRWIRHPDGRLEPTSVTRERAAEAEEEERLFPGLAKALQDDPGPSLEEALDKFRELSRHDEAGQDEAGQDEAGQDEARHPSSSSTPTDSPETLLARLTPTGYLPRLIKRWPRIATLSRPRGSRSSDMPPNDH